MPNHDLKSRLQMAPAFWGLVTGSALLVIGHNPRKSVIPFLIGGTFACSLIAQRYKEKAPMKALATAVSLALAGLTGYCCFKFPLPFS